MDTGELDASISGLFPELRGARDETEFLLDPATLDGRGTVRDYYVEYLHWLGIPAATLPPERVYIHAGRPQPAALERAWDPARPADTVKYSLYLDRALYSSTDAIRMAIAHEMTHLFLMRNGQQVLPAYAASLPAHEEVRTDVASIVLGFGKLVLNGVAAFQEAGKRSGYVYAQLGYLPVSSFAYLYGRVNTLVGVPPNVSIDGLNEPARKALAAAWPSAPATTRVRTARRFSRFR